MKSLFLHTHNSYYRTQGPCIVGSYCFVCYLSLYTAHYRWKVHPGTGAWVRARGRAAGLGVGAAQDVLAAGRRAAHAARRAPLRLAQRLRRQQLRAVLALATRPLLEANRSTQKCFQRVSHVLLPAEHAAKRHYRRREPL